MRSPEEIRAEWCDLLPPGSIERSENGNLAKLMLAFCGPVADLEADIATVTSEISPGRAVQLLADYEAVLGPDPCGRDALATTLALRQALAEQRWTASADNSISGLRAYASALGVQITIEEPEPTVCGAAICGVNVCSTVQDRLVWIVNINSSGAVSGPDAAICGIGASGVTVCGDVLLPIIANEFVLVSCPLRHLAPADTTVVFGYGSSGERTMVADMSAANMAFAG